MSDFNVGDRVMWSGPLSAPRPQLATIMAVHNRGEVYTIRPDGGEPRTTQSRRVTAVDTWMCEVCEGWFPEAHLNSEAVCRTCQAAALQRIAIAFADEIGADEDYAWIAIRDHDRSRLLGLSTAAAVRFMLDSEWAEHCAWRNRVAS